MSAQGAAGAGVAAQPTSSNEPGQDPGQQAGAQEPHAEEIGERLGNLLQNMDLPDAVLEDEGVKPKTGTAAAAPNEPAAAATPAGQQGAAAQQPGQQQQAQQPAAAAAPKKDEDHPIPDEWPASAKQRVGEEAEKRRRRTESLVEAERQRDEYKAEVARLSQQRPVQVAPSEKDPLADVNDVQALQAAVVDYERLLEWSTLNPDGAENVVVGYDAQRQPIVKNYTAQDMAKIRLDCDRTLRHAVPAKAVYLRDFAANEAYARQARPELFEPGSETNNEYRLVLQQLPEITRFPEHQLWIADAIAGRNDRLAKEAAAAKAAGGGNGKGGALSPTAAALLRPQPKAAPAVPNVRTPAPATEGGARSSAASDDDVKQREVKVIENAGDDNAMEDLVTSLRESQPGAKRLGQQPALV